jgi:AcrR family transcriptional regulator
VREDIVQAATRVFSRRGYHAASMAEIADEVGMRKPSLYHHVRKKEDLLFAIHERLIDELIDETMAVLSTSRNPEEKMREVLRVAVGLVARHRDGVTVFLRERRSVSGERWAELTVKRDLYEKMVGRVVSEGIADERFIDVPAAVATRAILGMANWSSMWFEPEGELAAESLADIFAQLALNGLIRR